ncbi:L-asparagine transporter-like permease [Mobiluncus mulieris]|uniref:General aromatic amino acid permease n=1 Tax=Mobiluncus mulieris TaxID=2052 RepID=A0A8G2HS59_9ACTO|nr:amino acid permease [Mobiluncus mulieris]EEJ53006.1 amino acid permease [Mobiluncus mulieris ATCC 35243]MBB5847200.1 L-asparagine transporter-like permease [Mobiluncus mulieris]MCU9971827.1 amino acid permease [Mobiluncus mulieris]MCU9975022.1 amino acid permease [Mobiluncus mulieris]MCV0001983.1 amino acid permease [Mobiluncus mulieris]
MSQKDAKKQSNRIPGNSEKPRDNTPHTQLKRRLTHRQIAMIGLSGALGTGLFLGSGSTISFAGPATIVSYCLAGMVALAVVWALAEIVSVYPIPGGHGAVAASFLGKSGGYLARWNLAIEMLVAVGAEVTASATYLQHWFPGLHIGVGTVLCSLFIVGLNLATVRLYGFAEYWFSMIKVTAVVVFILLGVSLIFTGSPAHPEPVGLSHLTAHGGFAPLGLTGVLLATCMAVFSFGGIENVSIAAAESENPSRSIPRAAKTMIWRLLFFYVLGIGVILALQDWQETVKASGNAEASPFVKVMDMVGIPAAGHVMNAILLIAALSAANGCLYSGSRMIHSLALDRMAPAFAARTAENGAPRGAVTLATLCFVVASVLAIVSPAEAFMYLYGCATVGILVTWVIIMLTHLKFRKHYASITDERPPARLWGYPVVNWLVILISIAVFVALPWAGLAVAWYAGIPYLVILVVSYLVLSRVSHLPEPAPLEIHRES